MRKYPYIFTLLVLLQLSLLIFIFLQAPWFLNLSDILGKHISKLPLSDNKLVDLNNFYYKINKEHMCDDQNILLLVVVSSAPSNFERRLVIRETWGQRDDEVKIVFSLGEVPNNNLQRFIQNEDNIFQDIVQGNFLDSYKNLTYKSTMSLKYATYNCPSAKFILKCDDDVFVNMPLLKVFLKEHLTIWKTDKLLFCNVNVGMKPIRDATGIYSMWYVSYTEWPEDTYPVYCSGWYVLMSFTVAEEIYKKAQELSFFWVDDVFLTGIAAGKIKDLIYVNMISLTLADSTIYSNMLINQPHTTPAFIFGGINMPVNEIRLFWDYVQSQPVNSSVFQFISDKKSEDYL